MTRGIIPKYPQESDYLQDAKYSFDALGDKCFIKLKKNARHASFLHQQTSYIDKKYYHLCMITVFSLVATIGLTVWSG